MAAGIVDALKAEGIKAFGPSKDAARLEGSKGFAKEVMRDANILTPEAKICDHPDIARTFIETREYPLVIKADGLAGGKGVMVCSTKAEALAAVERIMVREEFGAKWADGFWWNAVWWDTNYPFWRWCRDGPFFGCRFVRITKRSTTTIRGQTRAEWACFVPPTLPVLNF